MKIPVFWLMCPSCPLEISLIVLARKLLFLVFWLRLVLFFLRFYWPRLRLRQINWQYPAMLTSYLVNNVYIACLLGDTRGNWVGGPRYTFLNIDTEFAFRWVQVLWPSLWRRRGHDPNNLSKMRISVHLSRVRELWRPVFLRTPVPAVHWLHL